MSGMLLRNPSSQPLDPVTFAIGTISSDDSGQIAESTPWHQATLKRAESVGSTTALVGREGRGTCIRQR